MTSWLLLFDMIAVLTVKLFPENVLYKLNKAINSNLIYNKWKKVV